MGVCPMEGRVCLETVQLMQEVVSSSAIRRSCLTSPGVNCELVEVRVIKRQLSHRFWACCVKKTPVRSHHRLHDRQIFKYHIACVCGGPRCISCTSACVVHNQRVPAHAATAVPIIASCSCHMERMLVSDPVAVAVSLVCRAAAGSVIQCTLQLAGGGGCS